MNKVRMLVGLSGPTLTLSPGDPYECDESEAVRLIGARYAIPWVEDEIERAVSRPIVEARVIVGERAPETIKPKRRKK